VRKGMCEDTPVRPGEHDRQCAGGRTSSSSQGFRGGVFLVQAGPSIRCVEPPLYTTCWATWTSTPAKGWEVVPRRAGGDARSFAEILAVASGKRPKSELNGWSAEEDFARVIRRSVRYDPM